MRVSLPRSLHPLGHLSCGASSDTDHTRLRLSSLYTLPTTLSSIHHRDVRVRHRPLRLQVLGPSQAPAVDQCCDSTTCAPAALQLRQPFHPTSRLVTWPSPRYHAYRMHALSNLSQLPAHSYPSTISLHGTRQVCHDLSHNRRLLLPCAMRIILACFAFPAHPGSCLNAPTWAFLLSPKGTTIPIVIRQIALHGQLAGRSAQLVWLFSLASTLLLSFRSGVWNRMDTYTQRLQQHTCAPDLF